MRRDGNGLPSGLLSGLLREEGRGYLVSYSEPCANIALWVNGGCMGG